jgi:glucose dehydrogenase
VIWADAKILWRVVPNGLGSSGTKLGDQVIAHALPK